VVLRDERCQAAAIRLRRRVENNAGFARVEILKKSASTIGVDPRLRSVASQGIAPRRLYLCNRGAEIY
jgi:hypothetical protein